MVETKNLYQNLVDPYTLDKLELHLWQNSNSPNGILFNPKSAAIYPIVAGVPVLLKNKISKSFYNNYENELLNIIKDNQKIQSQIETRSNNFSFSMEWNAFEQNQMDKTWGLSTDVRLEQFYLETGQTETSIVGKIILDAGCGNGLLTAALAQKGAIVYGIDFSESVFQAAPKSNLSTVLYVQGDLENLPFEPNFFDIIISNGVIHHTQNTKSTFSKVAKTVKNGGLFYVWLYSRSPKLYFSIFLRVTDFCRSIVNKLPLGWQIKIVRFATFILYYFKLWRNIKMDYNTLLIDIFDTLTPKYKHYHSPVEVAQWYYECDFQLPILSHWDNPYGFGIVAIKQKMEQVPGMNYQSNKVIK